MPSQDIVQQLAVDLGLFLELVDPGPIFVPANTRGDGNDVFRGKDFCCHTFVFDRPRFAHGFFRQPGRGQKPPENL